MNRPLRLAALALATAVVAFPAAARAAGPSMPTCAAGDPVVWENTHSVSKTYHLQGDTYFGNTKSGRYACRSDAAAAGYHASGSERASMAPDASASAPPPHHHHHHHHASASPAPSPAGT